MKKTIDFGAFVADASSLLEKSVGKNSSSRLKSIVVDFCENYKNGGYYQAEQLFNYLQNNKPTEASERLLGLLESDRLAAMISECDDVCDEWRFKNGQVISSLSEVTQYIRRVCDLASQLPKEGGDSTPDQKLGKTIVWLELFWYSKIVQWGSDRASYLPNFLLNRYNYLFVYINHCIIRKSDIFTKGELETFKKHIQKLQEERKFYKYLAPCLKNVIDSSRLWSNGHHRLHVVENMGDAFDDFLKISEAGSHSMFSMIAKYILIILLASLMVVTSVHFALPLISLSCGISCFLAGYFAISDYEDYQLRKTRDAYFLQSLGSICTEIVNMVPCFEFFFLDEIKRNYYNERALVRLNIEKNQGKVDAKELEGYMGSARNNFNGTYCSFFSKRTNRQFFAASILDSRELILDKVHPLEEQELLDIQAEFNALLDPEKREEMEAYLKEAGVPFESKAATLTI
jgi:hypothetical protein